METIPNAFGGYIDESALRRRLRVALDKTKLKRVRFHDLRHTFGTIAVQAFPRGIPDGHRCAGAGHLRTCDFMIGAAPALRRLVAVACVMIIGAGAEGCASGEQETTATDKATPAPSKADRAAAKRAWRRYMTSLVPKVKRANNCEPPDCTAKVSLSGEFNWQPISAAFLATGSISIISRSSVTRSERTFFFPAHVERRGRRWMVRRLD